MEEAQAEKKPVQIAPDTMMEVVDMNNQLIFVGRVESCVNGVLTLREASGQDVPPAIYNDEYKLQCFQDGKMMVLSGKISGNNSELWRLDRLEGRFIAEQRNYFRQRVKLACHVLPQAGGRGPAKEKPGEVIDVSAGGLLLKSREEYRSGDILSIRDVYILPAGAPFTFACQVRRVNPGEEFTTYGCEFRDMSSRDQDRLFQAIFAVQRRELQERKDRMKR